MNFHDIRQLTRNIQQLSQDEFALAETPTSVAGDNPIKPAFESNNIPVLFAIDDNYVPYLGVALRSLYAHSTPGHNYDIVIIESGMTQDDRRIIRTCCDNSENFSIRFISLGNHAQKLFSELYISNHLQPSAYFRLLAPELLKNHDKIIYLDSDLLVLADIAELHEADLEGRFIAACRDPVFVASAKKSASIRKYILNSLRLEKIVDYFNSGVLVMDLAKMRETDFIHGLDLALERNPVPRWHDQDLLNMVCRGGVTYLNPEWNNCAWNLCNAGCDVRYWIADAEYDREVLSVDRARVLHFSSHIKPWAYPRLRFADLFWHYAQRTPFFEALLYRLCEFELTGAGTDVRLP